MPALDIKMTKWRQHKLGLIASCVTAYGAVALFSASAANAAIEEKCYNGDAKISQLRAELKAEGQAPIYVGNQQNIGRDGQIFYSNSTGKRGYVVAFNSTLIIKPKADGSVPAGRGIKGDVGYDFVTPPTKACMGITMANIKTFQTTPASSAKISAEALTGIDPKISKAALAKDTFGNARVYDTTLPRAYSLGFRIAIVADTIVPENGGERFGPRLVFGYSPGDAPMRQGDLSIVDGDGVARTMATTSSTRQTDLAYALNRSVQVAKTPAKPEQ